ncbi:ATP-binding protein [bacterium]|nr:ATP-binding protein [bacterium]
MVVMFGKIKRINNNEVTIENISGKAISSLIGCHVIFLEDSRRIVGEVTYIDEVEAKILLVGEIINNVFNAGIIKKPSGIAPVRVINKDELELIIGKSEIQKENLLLGTSSIYKTFNVSVPLNDIFANHLAIIGNTGSGKSCGVARMLQNLFFINKPINSHIVLFDAYGEYVETFKNINNLGLNFASFSGNSKNGKEYQLKFPAWFLDVDDLALLLRVSSPDQLPVLKKSLKLVKIFKSNTPEIKRYKNDIIAKCLMDILTSGRSSSTIRDQVIAVLTHYNTEDLNLDSTIHQPGYDRTFRQCLLIDDSGKMNAIFEVMKFLQQFENIDLESIDIVDAMCYSLEDLYSALEFSLISEGTINNDIIYKEMNILKTRLQSIINSDNKHIFNVDEYIGKEEFVRDMFIKNNLVNIDLSDIDDDFAKVLTKIYSKLLFNYTTSLEKRGSLPFNIILEEAHRYVQNDNDINIIGYNIFDRITKEGRKYGTLLTFITQRPSELSTTSLSQCANFIVFRVFHPADLEIVRTMSTNVSMANIEQIKSLSPGSAFAFGVGFKIPILVNFELPNPIPESTSVNVKNIWF